jgi:protein-L-isoaspartate(D-aspartate) O-methyltransferase
MGLKVTAVESEASLTDSSEQAFGFGLHENRPTMVTADPKGGVPSGAPFRLILIEGAVESVPTVLTSQLGEGGRLLVIRREPGRAGRILMLRKLGGGLTEVAGPDAAGPILPDFASAPGFVF